MSDSLRGAIQDARYVGATLLVAFKNGQTMEGVVECVGTDSFQFRIGPDVEGRIPPLIVPFSSVLWFRERVQ